MDGLNKTLGGTWYDLFSASAADPLIVLVTGMGAQAVEQWDDPLCRGLALHGYSVLRFDHRGVRGAVNGAFSMDELAKDALSLVKALSLNTPFHLVGASMGGMIAQSLALQAPHLVKSLTCIFSAAHGAIASKFQWPASGVGVDAQGYMSSRVALFEALNNSTTYALDTKRATATAAEAERRGRGPSGEVLGLQLQALLTFGAGRAALKTLGLPALILHGDRDPVIDVAYGVELKTAFAPGNVTFQEIKGMGHFLAPGAWAYIEPLLLAHMKKS
jgi:pimeloyl-ACP methyl ester carboxylesterase